MCTWRREYFWWQPHEHDCHYPGFGARNASSFVSWPFQLAAVVTSAGTVVHRSRSSRWCRWPLYDAWMHSSSRTNIVDRNFTWCETMFVENGVHTNHAITRIGQIYAIMLSQILESLIDCNYSSSSKKRIFSFSNNSSEVPRLWRYNSTLVESATQWWFASYFACRMQNEFELIFDCDRGKFWKGVSGLVRLCFRNSQIWVP